MAAAGHHQEGGPPGRLDEHVGGVALDHGMGRSAYVCPNRDCFEEAKRRRKLQKALRCQVGEALLEALEQRLQLT